MTLLGQQGPTSDLDVRRRYDAVGVSALEDEAQARRSLTMLAENAIRGVVGEYRLNPKPHVPCPACGCVGVKP
jgi:hypothetical protein